MLLDGQAAVPRPRVVRGSSCPHVDGPRAADRSPIKRAQAIQKLRGVMPPLGKQFIVLAPGFGKNWITNPTLYLFAKALSRFESLIGVGIDSVRGHGWNDKGRRRGSG